ncbi:hypothetical protein NE580_13120, partial [[Ruminococcus] torques]|nr:hypothetical protein [[Ruminococcus] torques]
MLAAISMNVGMRCGGIVDHGAMQVMGVVVMVVVDRQALGVLAEQLDQVVCLNRHVCCSGHPEQVSGDPAFVEL